MTIIKKTKFGSIVFCVTATVVICLAMVGNANESKSRQDALALLESLRKPANSKLIDVPEAESSYTDKSEYETLAVLRGFFDYSKRHNPKALENSSSKQFSLLSAEYKLKSAVPIKGWNKKIRSGFSASVLAWNNGEPTVVALGYEDYLSDLVGYSQAEILGYIVDAPAAYVLVAMPGSKEFQIIQLVWSDRDAPYFQGYHLLAATEAETNTSKLIYSPEFLEAFQERLK